MAQPPTRNGIDPVDVHLLKIRGNPWESPASDAHSGQVKKKGWIWGWLKTYNQWIVFLGKILTGNHRFFHSDHGALL